MDVLVAMRSTIIVFLSNNVSASFRHSGDSTTTSASSLVLRGGGMVRDTVVQPKCGQAATRVVPGREARERDDDVSVGCKDG